MKKRVQLAILLLFILLSCTDNADMTEHVTGTVGFHAADVASSRAAVVGLPGLQTGFRVNAYVTGTEEWSVAKDNPNTKPGLMWNQEVTWTGSAWTYTPVKYWPGNNGKVSFFAWNEIFKNNPDVFRVSEASMAGAPQLTYTVPNAQSDQHDLVTAMEPDKIATGGAVSLTFGHVLSRIGFTAKLEDHYEGVTVTITSLKVKYTNNAVESKGVYTFGETNPWLPPTGKAYMSHTGDVVVDAPGIPLNNDAPPAETDLTTDTRANYLMLLPQEVDEGDMEIEVKWTVNGGIPNSQTVNLPAQTWEPGYRYDYSLRVSLTNGITFDPVQVNPWETPLHQPCTITYNANGGTDEDIVEHRVTGVTYQVGDYIFGRDLHLFREWNTERGGGGKTYRAGDNITCDKNLPLYAQWDPVFDGMTNCYMVAPDDEITIPVSRAFTYEKETFTNTLRTGGTYDGAFEAEVIWDDNTVINGTPSVSGSGSKAVVTVKTNNKSGNAVVKIYKAGDSATTPVWSYHIWVTDPDAIVPWENTNQPGYIFMDRNLGATEAANSLAGRGLFYQWGRKDPFPGGKSGTAGYAVLYSFTGLGTAKYVTDTDYAGTDQTTAAQINASIQHPTVFFSAVSSGDWLSARENALWNVTSGSQRIKSIYDPCPSSWRVPEHVGNVGSPDNSPWKGLTTEPYNSGDNGGATFTGQGDPSFYPAAGSRSNSDGSFSSGGYSGMYWGASVADSYGYSLYFSNGGYVGVAYNDSRAGGFSVRCVQE